MSTGRKIFIIRHGERMDALYNAGPAWINQAVDDTGVYEPLHANMPAALQDRKNYKSDWRIDPNLTEMGYLAAQAIGKGFRREEIKIDQIVTSPALRCARTAQGIAKGLDFNFTGKICLEPGLYESGLFANKFTHPEFFDIKELNINFGIVVNPGYHPAKSMKDVPVEETFTAFCKRITDTLDHIQQTFPHAKNIILLTHAPCFDALTTKLCRRPTKTLDEYLKVVNAVPYCGVLTMTENPKAKRWDLRPPPTKPFTVSAQGIFEISAFLNFGMLGRPASPNPFTTSP